MGNAVSNCGVHGEDEGDRMLREGVMRPIKNKDEIDAEETLFRYQRRERHDDAYRNAGHSISVKCTNLSGEDILTGDVTDAVLRVRRERLRYATRFLDDTEICDEDVDDPHLFVHQNGKFVDAMASGVPNVEDGDFVHPTLLDLLLLLEEKLQHPFTYMTLVDASGKEIFGSKEADNQKLSNDMKPLERDLARDIAGISDKELMTKGTKVTIELEFHVVLITPFAPGADRGEPISADEFKNITEIVRTGPHVEKWPAVREHLQKMPTRNKPSFDMFDFRVLGKGDEVIYESLDNTFEGQDIFTSFTESSEQPSNSSRTLSATARSRH